MNKKDPRNYRPIAPMSCIAELFTSMIKKRIVIWLEKKNVIREEQAGFREGRGYSDNVFLLKILVNLKLSKTGGKIYAFFIDFVTVFPSINHELLWEKMEKVGLSRKIINTCKNLYAKA